MKIETPPAEMGLTFFWNNSKPKLRFRYPVGNAREVELTSYYYDGKVEQVDYLSLDELEALLVANKKERELTAAQRGEPKT